MKATDANKLRSNIQRVMLSIGNTNGTRMPPTQTNVGPVVQRYWLTSYLGEVVRGMIKEATKAAEEAGVIFDAKEEPLPEGTTKQTYKDDDLFVMVKVNRASNILDSDLLKLNLRKAKVSQAVIDDVFANSTRKNAAPHKFTAVLIED